MKWVNDIMIPDVVTVKKGTPVTEAIEKLVKCNVAGLPVINDNGELIGIISEKDVLSLAISFREKNYSCEEEGLLVEDFMTKDVVTIEVTESLNAVTSCLLKNKFRGLPVLSNGKLAGIATRRDVISYILDMQREKK